MISELVSGSIPTPWAIYSPCMKSHWLYHSSFTGAEKLEGHHSGEDGRASCLGFPYVTWEPCKEDHVEVPEQGSKSR
jgi:hypothetical protein